MSQTRPTARQRRDRLIEANRHIVAPIARQLASQIPDSFETEDLVNEGMLALVSAATRYRPKNHGGAPFSAYARFRVRGAMLDAIRGRNWERATKTESIDAPATAREDGGRMPERYTMPDFEQALDRQKQLALIRSAIEQLPERSRAVIELYYSEQHTSLEAIGQLYGVGARRASTYHCEAIRQLRGILADSATT